MAATFHGFVIATSGVEEPSKNENAPRNSLGRFVDRRLQTGRVPYGRDPTGSLRVTHRPFWKTLTVMLSKLVFADTVCGTTAGRPKLPAKIVRVLPPCGL
jgi:hypothetical protein